MGKLGSVRHVGAEIGMQGDQGDHWDKFRQAKEGEKKRGRIFLRKRGDLD